MFFFFKQFFKNQTATKEPPIFYGTVIHPKKPKRKRTKLPKAKLRQIGKLSLALCILGFLFLCIGVLACIYTLYVHDQLFDSVVYSTVVLTVLSFFSALVTFFYFLISK